MPVSTRDISALPLTPLECVETFSPMLTPYYVTKLVGVLACHPQEVPLPSGTEHYPLS